MKKINLTKKEYQGKCLGIVDGKVVIKDKDIKKVMEILNTKYADKKVSITSIPKGNKIFVL